MRTISLSEGQYRRAVEVLEGEDNQKKRQLETFGMEVDISIIKQGGAFDNPPFIPFE